MKPRERSIITDVVRVHPSVSRASSLPGTILEGVCIHNVTVHLLAGTLTRGGQLRL